MIQIPDTQYDIDFWRDVDHEGIGGHSGDLAPVTPNEQGRRSASTTRHLVALGALR